MSRINSIAQSEVYPRRFTTFRCLSFKPSGVRRESLSEYDTVMNYKKALNNNDDIVKHKGVQIFGVSLLLWILLGFVFLTLAASMSHRGF